MTESEKLLKISLDVLKYSTAEYQVEHSRNKTLYNTDTITKAIDIFIKNSIILLHSPGMIIFGLKSDMTKRIGIVYSEKNYNVNLATVETIFFLNSSNTFAMADHLIIFNSRLYEYNDLADAIVHDTLNRFNSIAIMRFFGLIKD